MVLPARRARLADIQARQVEVGRIRLGTSETKNKRSGNGTYQAPVKLERFRLTSRSEMLIKQAAEEYGGEPGLWTPQSGGAQQHEVIVEATSISVIVPPDPLSQYYEQWTAGKCTRRCDGMRELLEDAVCPCGPDPMDKKTQGCKPTTRVSLMLADLPGVGVWRLETHGYNAAAELPAVVDLLTRAGGNVAARLEMEERSAQIPDPRDPNKTVTSRFMVPVLHIAATPAVVVVGVLSARGRQQPAGELEAAPGQQALPAPAPTPALPAAPQGDPWRQAGSPLATAFDWFVASIDRAPVADLDKWADKVAAEQRLPEQARAQLQGLIQARRPSPPPPPRPIVVPAVRSMPNATVVNLPADDTPPWEDPADTRQQQAEPADEWGPAPAAPPDPWDRLPAAPTAPPAPAAPVDRAAAWNQVNMWAGERGWTSKQIKEQFGEFDGTGLTLTTATGEQLQQFYDWLRANRSVG